MLAARLERAGRFLFREFCPETRVTLWRGSRSRMFELLFGTRAMGTIR